MNKERRLFRFLSLLFQYPSEWIDYDLNQELEEYDRPEVKTMLRSFVREIEAKSMDRLLEEYVETFDLKEATSLYLSYGIWKDERTRGQVLVELKEQYRDAGLEMEEGELPDYLPLLLEFFSVAPEEVVDRVYQTFKGDIERLRQALKEAKSPYAHLLDLFFLVMENRGLTNDRRRTEPVMNREV